MRKAFICPTKYVQGENELLNLGYFVKTFGKKDGKSSAIPRISGITSLLLRTKTRAPFLTPFRFMSPILFSVARLTVAPARVTGSICAIGVNFPVLPTCQTTSFKTVESSSGSNLNAIAHFGNLLV